VSTFLPLRSSAPALKEHGKAQNWMILGRKHSGLTEHFPIPGLQRNLLGSDPRSRAARAGHDLSQDEVQNYVDEEAKRKNTTKSKVRAKVEHVFRILKRVFGSDKVRYRGIAKNHHRLCACFALIKLYLHRKRLAPLGA
jgi:hypothetical protein